VKTPTTIENPILNSPFEEPRRHFRFDENGITDQIVAARRASSYFIPIAQPKKKSKDHQQTFEGWTEDRIEENKTVNAIRPRVVGYFQIVRPEGHPTGWFSRLAALTLCGYNAGHGETIFRFVVGRIFPPRRESVVDRDRLLDLG